MTDSCRSMQVQRRCCNQAVAIIPTQAAAQQQQACRARDDRLQRGSALQALWPACEDRISKSQSRAGADKPAIPYSANWCILAVRISNSSGNRLSDPRGNTVVCRLWYPLALGVAM